MYKLYVQNNKYLIHKYCSFYSEVYAVTTIHFTLQDMVLDFSPGPIQAVDGDRGLGSPIRYAILSGSTCYSEVCASNTSLS